MDARSSTQLRGRLVQLVRPLEAEFPLIVRWRNESADCFFDSRPITLESHARWFWELAKRPSERYYVIHTLSGQPVGTVGLGVDELHGCAEYGRFLIGSEHRRKGYGRDALLALLVHAFDDLHLHRVYGDLLAGNEAGIALDLALGFRSEGLFRQAVRHGDRYLDVVRMAVLRHEFEAIRPILEEQCMRLHGS